MSIVVALSLLHFVWEGAVIGAVAWCALKIARTASMRYAIGVIALMIMAIAPVVTAVIIRQAPPLQSLAPSQFHPESSATVEASVAPSSHATPAFESAPSTLNVDGGLKLKRTARGQAAVVAVSSVMSSKEATAPTLSFGRRSVQRGRQAVSDAVASTLRVLNSIHISSSFAKTLLGAWLIGVGLLSVRLTFGWLTVRRLTRVSVQTPQPEIVWSAQRLTVFLGISRAVTVLESALVEVPTAMGWLKPVVLLPTSALTGLSMSQIEALLAHELAHIKRHDYLVNLMQSAIETLLFYHPMVWLISRHVRHDRELCCDDLAIAACDNDRLTYASALADLESMRHVPAPALAANGGSLLARIKRVLAHDERSVSRGRTNWTAGVAVLLLALIAVPMNVVRTRASAQPATASLTASSAPVEKPHAGIPSATAAAVEQSPSGAELGVSDPEIGPFRIGDHVRVEVGRREDPKWFANYSTVQSDGRIRLGAPVVQSPIDVQFDGRTSRMVVDQLTTLLKREGLSTKPIRVTFDDRNHDANKSLYERQESARTSVQDPKYIIKRSDVLHVTVLSGGIKQAEFQLQDYTVQPDGTIAMPLFQTVKVADLTVAEANEAIAKSLISGKFYNQVDVDVYVFPVETKQALPPAQRGVEFQKTILPGQLIRLEVTEMQPDAKQSKGQADAALVNSSKNVWTNAQDAALRAKAEWERLSKVDLQTPGTAMDAAKSVPLLSTDALVVSYLNHLEDLDKDKRKTKAENSYADNHPRILGIDSEIASVQKQLRARLLNLVDSAKLNAEVARDSADRFQQQYEATQREVSARPLKPVRNADISREYTVQEDGSILVPYAGRVKAGGLTVTSLEEAVRSALKAKSVDASLVSASIEGRSSDSAMFVLGEVKSPGVFPWRQGLTLSQVLSLAGGPRVAGAPVEVTVPFGSTERYRDMSRTVPASATINVLPSPLLAIKVMGAVRKPGSLSLTENRSSVADALVSAGGLNGNAGTTIRIRRAGATDWQLYAVDDLNQGKLNNVMMKNGDIVDVPVAPKFFVMGFVAQTGEFQWEPNLTLERALLKAGGVTADGAASRATVRRMDPRTKQVTAVDLGKDPMTFVILADDVIDVPKRRL